MSELLPIVAIVGRPNVGKSTLFNRLLGQRRAIVDELPGLTRDRHYAEAEWSGRKFLLVDTGGIDPGSAHPIQRQIIQQTAQALEEADVSLLVVDAAQGITALDREVAERVRRRGRPMLLIVNKADSAAREEEATDFYSLGVGTPIPVSALHGRNAGELLEEIVHRLPATETAPVDESAIRIAVVGRPNVGKSSLVNSLLGQERTIVSEVAGTTRDSVDVTLEHRGRRFRLVDTAGIRRKARTERGPEVLSVVSARKRIEESDVALLVLDAGEGVTAQDAAVASAAWEVGKGLVIAANKWDLAGGPGEEAAKEFRRAVAERLAFASHAPLLFVSAKTRRGVGRLLDSVVTVAENRRRRISTGELNRVLGRALRDKPPRTAAGGRLKVFYVAQTGSAPPTFTLVANREEALHFSEARRVENIIRGAADFSGCPIRISVRERAQTSGAKSRVRGSRSRVQSRGSKVEDQSKGKAR